MEFIGEYWYVWLVVMLAGYGYALLNQVRRIQHMMSSPLSALDPSSKNSFFSGVGTMFMSGFIGMTGMVLLVISVIVNI